MSYADAIRTWKGIPADVVEHACFISNALDHGDTPYQAHMGWALMARAGATAQPPKPNSDGSSRRAPCRVKHVGRITYRKGRRRTRWDRGDATTRLARAFRDTRINRERREDVALDAAEASMLPS